MITIAIADDEPLVRDYLRRVLQTQPDFTVVAIAQDAAEAAQVVTQHRPDVLLMDLRMGTDETETLERIESLTDHTKVVVLTGFPDERAVLAAMQAGAAGFLTKATSPDQLAAVLRLAAGGHRVLGPDLEGDPIAGRDALNAARAGLGALTPREREVLRLLGAGASNAAIAEQLGLRMPTVKGHVSAVLDKLGCRSRLQAGLIAQSAPALERPDD